MKSILFFLIVGTAINLCAAAEPSDLDSIKKCFTGWDNHPFSEFDSKPNYRVLRGSVKIAGVGGAIEDLTITEQPELILVRPNVSIMSKSTYRLMNPNGWYCFERMVNVMGASQIIAHCDARLSSTEGITVFGSGDPNAQGTTVMGRSTVARVDSLKDTCTKN